MKQGVASPWRNNKTGGHQPWAGDSLFYHYVIITYYYIIVTILLSYYYDVHNGENDA